MAKTDAAWIRNAGRGPLQCLLCRAYEGKAPGRPVGGHRALLPCKHSFCLPCLSSAWHHAPCGGQCPGCLASEDGTGSRSTLLKVVPLLSGGGSAKERNQGAEDLEAAIVKLGKAIEKREAAASSVGPDGKELASRATLYASLASLLEARDRVRGNDPSEELVRAWLCACSCPDAEGAVETTNWLGYGRALYYKSDREPSIAALRRARECAVRGGDEFNRRLVGIYLGMATLLDERNSRGIDGASVQASVVSHVEDLSEAARLLDDAFGGFEGDTPFGAHGKDFAKACAAYAERAMVCEKGSLQLTTAVDYNLSRWIEISHCEESASFHHSYGKALRRLSRVDEAVFHLQRATEINPQSAESWGNLGIALRQQGQLQASVDAQRKAIELAPKSGIGCFNLANALLEMNELHSALEFMNEAERLGVPPSKAPLVEKSQALIFEALKCKACNKPLAEICCTRCKNAFFCNAQCKRDAKNKHKKKCKAMQKRPIDSPKFMQPWNVLLMDRSGKCELRNEDGRRVMDSSEIKKMLGPGEGPKIVMEQNGDRIRRVETVGKIKPKSKLAKMSDKILTPKPGARF